VFCIYSNKNVKHRPQAKGLNLLVISMDDGGGDIIIMSQEKVLASNSPVPENIIKWTGSEKYASVLKRLSRDCRIEALGSDYIQGCCEIFKASIYDNHLHDSFRVWISSGLIYNWKIITKCLANELKKYGHNLVVLFEPELLVFAPKCEMWKGSMVFDFKKVNLGLFDSTNKQFKQEEVAPDGELLPNFEIFWLMIMNPEICIELGKKLPSLYIPGLLLPLGAIPKIFTVENTVYIGGDFINNDVCRHIVPVYDLCNKSKQI